MHQAKISVAVLQQGQRAEPMLAPLCTLDIIALHACAFMPKRMLQQGVRACLAGRCW